MKTKHYLLFRFISACFVLTATNVQAQAIPNCKANFTYKLKLVGPQEASVHFTNKSVSSGSSDSIIAYHWTFGDGKTSDKEDPNHKYTRFGKYQVCLTIATRNGCSSSECDSVLFPPPADGIAPEPIIPPSNNCGLNATWTSTESGTGVVAFTATTNNQPNLLYIWNFGDGTTGSGITVTHTYTHSGNYVVCLVIKVTVDNCTDTSCHNISVVIGTSPCQAAFDYCFLAAGAAGAPIQFTNTSSGTYTKSHWNFGDGTTSTLTNPVHTYSGTSPAYKVCLKISDAADNCKSTLCDSVYMAHTYVCVPPDTCINPALINHKVACPDVVAPVCGCNGVTYTNSCIAENYYGVTSWTQGECPGGITPQNTSGGGQENGLRSTVGDSIARVFQLSIFPNPSGGLMNIQFTLPDAANVDIEIADLTGRNIAHIFNSIQPSGTNLVNWNTDTMANGMYLVKMVVDGKEFSRQVSIAH